MCLCSSSVKFQTKRPVLQTEGVAFEHYWHLPLGGLQLNCIVGFVGAKHFELDLNW